MTRHVEMRWNLRQVMAGRGLFQTSDLVPLLAERGVTLSREHVYRLVTKTPQRLNMEILAALCDILDCAPNDLLQPIATTLTKARTGTDELSAQTGPSIGELRPIRAKIRRPHETP